MKDKIAKKQKEKVNEIYRTSTTLNGKTSRKGSVENSEEEIAQ